jgi:HNH endonuclease
LKHCIWCRRTDQETTFDKEAHTIPQSLGGQDICINVCDVCNHFFGQYYKGSPSVETIIKETFNITRIRLLDEEDIGKNKAVTKFSSQYFKVDLKKHKMELKPAYRLQRGFQEKIGRQIKKGLYKIFLEETERQKFDGHNSQYDFIREFCRYDLGDYPVFYFERLHGIIAMAKNWIVRPEFFLEPDQQFKYLVREPSFFEFEFLGHVFGIVTSRHWELAIDNYIKKTTEAKRQFFRKWRLVKNFNDIDLSLSILDDVHRP